MSLAEIQNQQARGAILGLLKDGTNANDGALHYGLTRLKGINVSRDQVRAALRWLEEQELISLDAVGEFLLARIAERGENYNAGQIVVDGIVRPRR